MSSSLGGWAAFTLYIGAAHNDATPDQRELLRAKLPPYLDRIRNDDPAVWKPAVEDLLKAVNAVMGPDWGPTGEFDEWIRKLLSPPD